MTQDAITPDFDCLGWIAQVQIYRGTSKLTIKREAVLGACIQKGQPLQCYLTQDGTSRDYVIVLLDGKPSAELEQTASFSWNTKVQQGGRKSSRFSISKAVAIGSGFRRHKQLFAYTAKVQTRPAIIVYLDGNPRHNTNGGDFKWKMKRSTSTELL